MLRAPENATHPKTQVTDRSQNLPFRVMFRFRVCLGRPLRGDIKESPEICGFTRKRSFWERSVTCVFCENLRFSVVALCSPLSTQ